MFTKLWLYPPLAIARLGPSPFTCENYSWGQNDLRPQGTGKTTLVPRETLDVGEDGTVRAYMPSALTFKDEVGFRPVCPFFELHGEWTSRTGVCTGPITDQTLADLGLEPGDVRWTVTVANHKPFHHTMHRGDRIRAHVELTGDTYEEVELHGVAPADSDRPLVPFGRAIPLGRVQLTRPSPGLRGCRLRFRPPHGLVYGPTDFNERVARLVTAKADSAWSLGGGPLQLPKQRLFLNRHAEWAMWRPRERPESTRRPRDIDFRTMPVRTFAHDDSQNDIFPSLGLVDDVSDGVVRCSIGGLSAVARVVVGPPGYAPDRRSVVSLADALKDRVGRAEVLEPEYLASDAAPLEIRDFFERVFETQGLMNVDVLNDRALKANRREAESRAAVVPDLDSKLFPIFTPLADRPLPLTELGRQRHRRMLTVEVLEDRVREDPTLVERMVRTPLNGESYFDQKMPALMRGSDSQPLHVTRRQYNILVEWARRLRRNLRDG